MAIRASLPFDREKKGLATTLHAFTHFLAKYPEAS